MAESMMAVQIAVRLVTKVTLPSTLTDTGVRVIHTVTMDTSCHRLADIAILTGPSVVADTFIGCNTLAIGAVAAAGDVTVCSFPSLLAITFKSIVARTMFTSWQRNTNIAVGTLPSYFAGTVVRCSAFSMNTSKSIVVTDWFKAGVQLCFSILNFRFFPSRLANDIALMITYVPVGAFQIFRLARMIVNV